MNQLSLLDDGLSSADLVWAGVDEVGRGPLAGSVVAAAVILPAEWHQPEVTDSKKLSAASRHRLAQQIREQALAWAIGEAIPAEIDRLNILQATFLAMRRAIEQLNPAPDQVLVDGRHCPPGLPCPCQAIVKGDSSVPAISAASILAKVYRDEQMIALSEQYPEYGFERHKGYPTKAHLQALAQYGIIPGVHRQSFGPVSRLLNQHGRTA